MMEGRSCTSITYNSVSSVKSFLVLQLLARTMIDNSGIAYGSHNFDHCDPYVEKIRSLFVPSLEPRIHSCLETLIYRKEQGSKNPCLKRCLEMAETWQEPIDNFFTKLNNGGFLESIIGHAIQYLIKGDLIDCFLNSIILNNRLNKVCQNVDELGIERDLLRYLSVWNYMHDRDYWVERDRRISMSTSRESYDLINCTSDLDVEVGSKFCNYRRDKITKRSLKRQAADDSSLESQKDKKISENVYNNDRLLPQYQSCLSVDSSTPEKFKLDDGRTRRSISQILRCRSSHCPIYRSKNPRRNDWEGKFLKLQVSDARAIKSKCDTPKCIKLSKLRLPCEVDDFISKFIRADSMLFELFSITRRKKFEASVINICRRINEILGKLDKNEVKKCRLHCEIFPVYFSFRMTKRESDGYQICLVNDFIAINKVEAKSRCGSRGSSITQLPLITENGNSRESGLTIYESAQFDLEHEIPQRIPSSPKNSEVVLNSKQTTLKDESPNVRNKEDADNFTCPCEPVDPLFNQLDLDTQKNSQPDNLKDIQIRTSGSNLRNSIREKSLMNCNDGIRGDEICMCHEPLDDVSHYYGNEPKNNGGSKHIMECKAEHSSQERPVRKDPLFYSTAVEFENPVCLCNDSFDNKLDPLDRQMEPKCAELVPKKSLFRLVHNGIIDKVSLYNNSSKIQSPQSDNDTKIELSKDNPGECLDKEVGDISEFSRRASNKSFTMNVENVENSKSSLSHPMVKRSSVINREVIQTRSNLTYTKSVLNVPNGNKMKSGYMKIACECPSDCTCANKETLDDESAACHSQCSFDTYHYDDVIKTLCPIKGPCAKNVSSQKSGNLSIVSSKIKPRCIETQTDSGELKKLIVPDDRNKKSMVFLKPVTTKILSRSSGKKGTKATNPHFSESMSGRYLKRDETSRNSCHNNSPIISTRLPGSKGQAQMINISIELCPESVGSMEKIRNNHEKRMPSSKNDRRRMDNFDYIQSGFLPLVRQSRCHPIDCDNSKIQINNFLEKKINYECFNGLNRVHSPPRPLESRDYVPPLKWHASSVRKSNVYGHSMKSDLRSNRNRTVRSMSEAKKIPREYETREFCTPIHHNEQYKEYKRKQMPLNKNKQSSKPPSNSKRFPGSVVDGHLCHAFSASSVDRMRHLIKTKLRRILLERDKSTNTPKTILTNEIYRVSLPNGKIERFPFSSNGCRTIWESRSASDSTNSSRSFALENHIRIRDRKKNCHLLYSSTKKSKNSSPNANGISQNSNCSKSVVKSIDSSNDFKNDRRNDRNKLVSMENRSRLAGGSDFVPPEKRPTPEEYLFLHKQRLQASKNKSRCSHDCEDKKRGDDSFNCEVHEIFRNQTLRSRYWNKVNANSLTKMYSSGISNEQMDVENFWIKKKVRGKNVQNLHSRPMRFPPNNNNDISRSINDIGNSLSNIDTINLRQKRFTYLDYDLRSKLLQYVNLCKNIKYSLLRKLRPNDVYDVTKTSIPCRDQYEIGDS